MTTAIDRMLDDADLAGKVGLADELQSLRDQAAEARAAHQAIAVDWGHTKADLAEARAALRTMSENEGRLQARIAELETEVTRLRGINGDLRHEHGRCSWQLDTLETKLSNLRAAAERALENVYRDDYSDEHTTALRAALEESKK